MVHFSILCFGSAKCRSHNIKFIFFADVNVRVAALTFMGAMVTVHAPLLEVSHILLPLRKQEEGSEATVGDCIL